MTASFDTSVLDDSDKEGFYWVLWTKHNRRAYKRKQGKAWETKHKVDEQDDDAYDHRIARLIQLERTIDRIRALIDECDLCGYERDFKDETAFIDFLVRQGATGKIRQRGRKPSGREHAIIKRALNEAVKQGDISMPYIEKRLVPTNHYPTLPCHAIFDPDRMFPFGKKWRKLDELAETIAA